jgi:hypothetical protein
MRSQVLPSGTVLPGASFRGLQVTKRALRMYSPSNPRLVPCPNFDQNALMLTKLGIWFFFKSEVRYNTKSCFFVTQISSLLTSASAQRHWNQKIRKAGEIPLRAVLECKSSSDVEKEIAALLLSRYSCPHSMSIPPLLSVHTLRGGNGMPVFLLGTRTFSFGGTK